MSLAPGEVFAGYTIVRLLGSGGMGEVYLAQHPRLPRKDALKILGSQVSADGDYRQRFVREADLAAKLWHPNIVAVHDRGDFTGQLWIAIDYVEGTDAASLLRDRYPVGMPVDEVATIVAAIAGALDYAHAHGLLHRDVKPANILLADPVEGERRILLSDFGIARTIGEISGLTATNIAVGTLPYAAPEQLMDEPIDGRADQYALAATAYHLLTGSPLFRESNPVAVIGRHLTTAPPTLAASRPELAALDPVLAAALAKAPADRFARCRDFAGAFAAATRSGGQVNAAALTRPAPAAFQPSHGPAAPRAGADTKPDKARGRRRLIVLAGAGAMVTLLAAAGILGYLMRSGNDRPAGSSGPSLVSPSTNRSTEPSSINSKCNASTFPLFKLDSQAAGEPTLALPHPPGWVFNTELNSSLIRAMMGDPELRANGFTPDVVVTLENLTDRVSTPQQALDAEVAGVTGTDVAAALDKRIPGTVCGYPSTTITYTAFDGHTATALIIAAQDNRNSIWAATITIQTTEPDNPDYINTKRAILAGFQFSLTD